MKSRRRFLSTLTVPALAAAAALLATSAFAGPGSSAKAEIGKPAPDFALKDVTGKEYKLSDYRGKIVVLQWINPQCPYCVRVISQGTVKSMREELKKLDKDIVHLAINSTNWMTAKESAAYLKQHKVDVPGLDDADGTVGLLYGAKTTPHMFVIDAEGILRYNGAIDDDRRGSKGDEATNYVVLAVEKITAGETVSPDQTKPYGCSVKYKK